MLDDDKQPVRVQWVALMLVRWLEIVHVCSKLCTLVRRCADQPWEPCDYYGEPGGVLGGGEMGDLHFDATLIRSYLQVHAKFRKL